jgi:hypothetical protein
MTIVSFIITITFIHIVKWGIAINVEPEQSPGLSVIVVVGSSTINKLTIIGSPLLQMAMMMVGGFVKQVKVKVKVFRGLELYAIIQCHPFSTRCGKLVQITFEFNLMMVHLLLVPGNCRCGGLNSHYKD